MALRATGGVGGGSYGMPRVLRLGRGRRVVSRSREGVYLAG